MNAKQSAVRSRVLRRFSRNDGVVVRAGAHKGRPACVSSCSELEVFSTDAEPFQYFLTFTDELGGHAFVPGDDLTSDPSGNQGKYGGPSRGGAAGGWMGVSGYRRR